jgi:hypothetical protein
MTKIKVDKRPNLDHAIFTDVDGPVNDEWTRVIWADFLKRVREKSAGGGTQEEKPDDNPGGGEAPDAKATTVPNG